MEGMFESSILFAVLNETMDFRAGRYSSLALSKKAFDNPLSTSFLFKDRLCIVTVCWWYHLILFSVNDYDFSIVQ